MGATQSRYHTAINCHRVCLPVVDLTLMNGFAGHCLRHLGLEGEEEKFVILKNPISLNHHNILPQKGLSDLVWLLYLLKN